LFRPWERAFKQFKCPGPQSVKNKFPAIQFPEKKFTKIEGIKPISMSANT